ncbi:MAG: adenylate/guanylate cyclase domain-containing protein [Chloroflexota bacterium]|jgi:guanylate cyclase
MGIYQRLERRITLPGDGETLRSQKTLSWLLVLVGSLFTFINVLFYVSLGSPPPTYSYLALAVFLLLAGLVVYAVPILWRPVAYLAILVTISLNAVSHLLGGGFQSGLAAAVWIMLGPIFASMFFSPGFTFVTFLFYDLIIIVAAILEPQAQSIAPDFSLAARTRIAAGNMILMAIIMTAAGIYLLRRVEFYRRRADELVHNMLPAPIAARLKERRDTIADAYDEVTVLFADMVGSTPLFASLEPAEAVDWLNEVFLMFDRLVERHNLEKIRTIGDNYMVAAGVPLARPDHAQAMTAFALDLLQGLETIPARDGRKMAFRVGINSGPVVAGVIGRAKYQYDLWGDTVNLASRMESHGQPGQVHVSPATYALIKDDFECTGRGAVPIKGKGKMETWYVIGRRPVST